MNNTASSPSKRNQVTLDGVTISWKDTRRMVEAEPDDMEMIGDFHITISASGANLQAIANAYICGEALQRVANLGDLLCPYSDLLLRPIGLSDLGDVVLQIYRGERKCDAVRVAEMSSLDPQRYSNDEVAMKSVAWMRDVAHAIVTYHSVLCRRDNHATDAWDTVVRVVNQQEA